MSAYDREIQAAKIVAANARRRTVKKRFLIIRRLDTDEEVHRIEVTGKTDRTVEKVERGVLRNMNVIEFYLDDTVTNPEASS